MQHLKTGRHGCQKESVRAAVRRRWCPRELPTRRQQRCRTIDVAAFRVDTRSNPATRPQFHLLQSGAAALHPAFSQSRNVLLFQRFVTGENTNAGPRRSANERRGSLLQSPTTGSTLVLTWRCSGMSLPDVPWGARIIRGMQAPWPRAVGRLQQAAGLAARTRHSHASETPALRPRRRPPSR